MTPDSGGGSPHCGRAGLTGIGPESTPPGPSQVLWGLAVWGSGGATGPGDVDSGER